MTYDEYIDYVARKNVVCPKCKKHNWTITDGNCFDDSKLFCCKECGYSKKLDVNALLEFQTKAKGILRAAVAGDFIYTSQIETLANEVVK